MIASLFSFFGGAAFRMVWGEVSRFFTAGQEHRFELDRIRLQEGLDAASHVRQMESIQLQHTLGIKVIAAQLEASVSTAETDAWVEAVKLTGKPSGNSLVDLWNGIIRPLLATECMLLWSLHLYRNGWVLEERDWILVGAALGVFVADRTLFRRGK